MNQDISKPRSQYKSLLVIYYALLAGIGLFAVFFLIIPLEPQEELHNYLRFVVIGVTLISYLVGQIINKNKLEKINQLDSLEKKLSQYQVTSIIKWAVLESAIILTIISYGLTQNFLYLGIFILMTVIFILHRPSIKLINSELSLSPEEIKTLK